MEDINVQLIDMDVMIPEHVVKNHDGSYTVFINARFNQEHRLKSYTHALEHIKNGDFDRDYGDVQEIEAAAHQVPTVPAPAPLPAPIVTVAENIKQPPKRRRRRRNRKKEQYAQDRLNFILENFSSRDTFAMAENQWLYWNGL